MLSALIAAAGVGSRMNSAIPKQYLELAGIPVISRSIQTLMSVEDISRTVVALSSADTWWSSLAVASDQAIDTVVGGNTRARSVLAGLQHLLGTVGADGWVLIHDAARPLIRQQDIQHLIDTVLAADVCGGLLAVPVTDTLKTADKSLHVTGTLNRQNVWQAQTPQMFRIGALASAITDGLADRYTLTDEASAMELSGEKPLIVEGNPDNIKLTHARDRVIAEILLREQQVD